MTSIFFSIVISVISNTTLCAKDIQKVYKTTSLFAELTNAGPYLHIEALAGEKSTDDNLVLLTQLTPRTWLDRLRSKIKPPALFQFQTEYFPCRRMECITGISFDDFESRNQLKIDPEVEEWTKQPDGQISLVKNPRVEATILTTEKLSGGAIHVWGHRIHSEMKRILKLSGTNSISHFNVSVLSFTDDPMHARVLIEKVDGKKTYEWFEGTIVHDSKDILLIKSFESLSRPDSFSHSQKATFFLDKNSGNAEVILPRHDLHPRLISTGTLSGIKLKLEK
ncbi:MAG: hypothetical protein JWQ35_1021 [Bacteriovoracaceae bacterium]|nr:hypothetical protein [Bacteriovoracaceae bacterium]